MENISKHMFNRGAQGTEESQIAEKHIQKYSTFLAISEMEIITILRFHLTQNVRMIKNQ